MSTLKPVRVLDGSLVLNNTYQDLFELLSSATGKRTSLEQADIFSAYLHINTARFGTAVAGIEFRILLNDGTTDQVLEILNYEFPANGGSSLSALNDLFAADPGDLFGQNPGNDLLRFNVLNGLRLRQASAWWTSTFAQREEAVPTKKYASTGPIELHAPIVQPLILGPGEAVRIQAKITGQLGATNVRWRFMANAVEEAA